MSGDSKLWAVAILGVLPVMMIAASAFVPPITQDPGYHNFADQRMICGIPNFWNVVSNAAFLVAAAFGARVINRRAGYRAAPLFVVMGTVLVAFGSAYYHWSPNLETLFWDRLPMTIVFMAVFAITIGERIDERVGRWSLVPLLVIGAASVFYWRATGDLRFYGAVQFYPMIAIVAMLILRPWAYSRLPLAGMIAFYIVAKLLESFDRQVATILTTGGHPWKHAAAAAALVWYFQFCGAASPGGEPAFVRASG